MRIKVGLPMHLIKVRMTISGLRRAILYSDQVNAIEPV